VLYLKQVYYFVFAPRNDELISSLLQQLRESVRGDPVTVVVSRRRLLQSTMLAISDPEFSFEKPPQIVFSGEDAQDHGGPRREFFRYDVCQYDCSVKTGELS